MFASSMRVTYERASGRRSSTRLHGLSHGDRVANRNGYAWRRRLEVMVVVVVLASRLALPSDAQDGQKERVG